MSLTSRCTRPVAEVAEEALLHDLRLRSLSCRNISVDVREPEVDDITCSSILGTCCFKPPPVSYLITTMSHSAFVCSSFMVARRSEADFQKLLKLLRAQFVYCSPLIETMKLVFAPPLKSLDEQALLMQCMFHRRFLVWVVQQPPLNSNHDLHAFLGCQSGECLVQNSSRVVHFAPFLTDTPMPARI